MSHFLETKTTVVDISRVRVKFSTDPLIFGWFVEYLPRNKFNLFWNWRTHGIFEYEDHARRHADFLLKHRPTIVEYVNNEARVEWDDETMIEYYRYRNRKANEALVVFAKISTIMIVVFTAIAFFQNLMK